MLRKMKMMSRMRCRHGAVSCREGFLVLLDLENTRVTTITFGCNYLGYPLCTILISSLVCLVLLYFGQQSNEFHHDDAVPSLNYLSMCL